MLDHVSVLGDTLALIAGEKAGIMKRGVPVAVAPQPREALEVFRRASAEVDAPLVEVGSDVTWKPRSALATGQSFDVSGRRGRYRVWTPLIGDFQQENAATAIAAVEVLAERGLMVSERGILEGLAGVEWPCRLQVLSRDGKQVLVDGAHNPDAMRLLVRAVRQYFKFDRVLVVFGATRGHSLEGMLSELAVLSPVVLPVESRHPRSGPAGAVATAARDSGLEVSGGPGDVGSAARRAMGMAGEGDLVLGTGSLSVAAEVIEELEDIAPEVYPSIKPPSPRAV
jgi:dihydrofolate synthase/folylpolyglutamate synthase